MSLQCGWAAIGYTVHSSSLLGANAEWSRRDILGLHNSSNLYRPQTLPPVLGAPPDNSVAIRGRDPLFRTEAVGIDT